MHVAVVAPLSNAELARKIGVAQSTISGWRKCGMPNGSLQVALEWVNTNRPMRGKRTLPAEEEILCPTVPLPENEDLYAILSRLRQVERSIAAQISGWVDIALPEVMAERAKLSGKAVALLDRKTGIINNRVERLRKEQRATIASIIATENAVVKLEKNRGKLIEMDAAKDLVSNALMPIVVEIRRLPQKAESDHERIRLSAIAESLLAVARDAAHEYVQFKLDAVNGAAA
jgi:hypothetical protein